jgi:hypothetical protein
MPIEKPTFWMRFKRMLRMTFRGHVLLKRIQRDPETGGYRIVTEETTREELPIEAVHITGKSNQYAIDEIKVIHPFNTDNNGFTAIDLNLWLESNLINDALALKWDGLKGLDAKKISLMLVIGVVAVIVVYVVMQGM